MTDQETPPDTARPHRRNRFDDGGKTNLEAKFTAQRLAFGPLMFQAARTLRTTGALARIKARGRTGITAEELEQEVTSLSIYGARLLLEAALAAEMVVLLEDDRYALTNVGFLVETDPMTRVNFDFVHDVCYQPFFWLEDSIREGKPVGLKEFGPWDTVYEGLTQLPEHVQRSWFAFDHFYSDSVFKAVLPIVFREQPESILDVGANTGKWMLQCCAHDPKVKITILDHPGQLARALANAAEAGCADRVAGQAIDFLDPEARLPTGFDAVWMSQFLDCFGEEEIISILERARPALNANGSLFILETYWDRQRYEAARFSVINTSLYFAAVANGNSKMYHSGRMQHCVEQAGMRIAESFDDIGVSHTLFRCVPA